MSSGDVLQLVIAAVLVVLAGVFSAAGAALAPFSKARADELVEEGRAGARPLSALLDDRSAYLNTALLLRIVCEVAAIALVALVLGSALTGWVWALVAIGLMTCVVFVMVGVGPRTLGLQHDVAVALAAAGPLTGLTRILGPIPRVLILLGNALTPGKGFREGPFSTETELRELVDIAEASAVIEAGERRMIHSVFDLGDTRAREVMVPRGDVVFIEQHKNLRQTMSLFLRSGFSRVPVVGENLDDVLGFAYLKDIVRRDFEAPDVEFTQKVEEVMRAHFVPDSKPVDVLLAEMQAMRQHLAVVVDEYGGTAGLVTIEDILEEIVGEITDEYDEHEVQAEVLGQGMARVPARFPLDDLDEVVGIKLEDEDVDSVGGLMAKHLGKVPIPGSTVRIHGLSFEAENVLGRRNRIGTVLVTRLEPASTVGDEESYAGEYA